MLRIAESVNPQTLEKIQTLRSLEVWRCDTIIMQFWYQEKGIFALRDAM